MSQKLTSKEALELSKAFHSLSVSLSNYRFENWDTLTKNQRQTIEDSEWSLLNGASDMTTLAVGLVLDESKESFEGLKRSTNKAKKAIKTLETVSKVIKVATTAVVLAAAVMSKDPGAIAKNSLALFKAATA